MMMLGAADAPGQTLLNSLVTDEIRASLISTANLFLQIAGIVTSVIGAQLVSSIQITGVWIIVGGLTVTAVVAAGVLLKRSNAFSPNFLR